MISHNYLGRKHGDLAAILERVSVVSERGDFTLGSEVAEFERRFALITGTRHAIGVANGTDALTMALQALDFADGNEVITTPHTFPATVGAIVAAGLKPVFADIGEDWNLDPAKAEEQISTRTSAILPVDWAGRPCDMRGLKAIGGSSFLPVIEDSCQAIGARDGHDPSGSVGIMGCFSLHPLKNLHVWGDGGVITTNADWIAEGLRLRRNHGLKDRDTCVSWGINSRLDTIQAAVGLYYLDQLPYVLRARTEHAERYDAGFADVEQVQLPLHRPGVVSNHHLYVIECEKRDELLTYLHSHDIHAKVHYPVPLHLQPAARGLGYRKGSFPRTERHCERALTLPVHEFLQPQEIETVIQRVTEFYR